MITKGFFSLEFCPSGSGFPGWIDISFLHSIVRLAGPMGYISFIFPFFLIFCCTL